MRTRIALGMIVTVASLEIFAACGNAAFNSESAGDASTDAASDATSFGDAAFPDSPSSGEGGGSACPNNGQGPDMVLLPNEQCIDSTEVTVAQYAAFIDALAAVSNPYKVPTDPRCMTKSVYAPDTSCLGTMTPQGGLPQTCVDWCDALAFCEWAGKRLCGGVDGGADLPLPSEPDLSSTWELACTRNGSQAYPYPGALDASTCNTSLDAGGALAAVKSFPGCVGGYPGVYDMAGNASEWVDYCDSKEGGADDQNCEKMGGSYRHLTGRCLDLDYAARITKDLDVGFRCCSN